MIATTTRRAERYRRAAEDALQQLDCCIGYPHGSARSNLACAATARTSALSSSVKRQPIPAAGDRRNLTRPAEGNTDGNRPTIRGLRAATPARGGGLAEVIDIILDKGLVIDAYVRVSLIGIEILTIDARIVIASVDTYLRFAEAVGRLDLQASDDSKGLPELVEGMTESGAKSKTKGALAGAKDALGLGDDDDDGVTTSRKPPAHPSAGGPGAGAPRTTSDLRRPRCRGGARRAGARRPESLASTRRRRGDRHRHRTSRACGRRAPCGSTGRCWRRRRSVAVLPVRFGTAMADDRAVVEELLAPAHDELVARLAELAGKVQITVKGNFDEERLLRGVVDALAGHRAAPRACRGHPGGGRVLRPDPSSASSSPRRSSSAQHYAPVVSSGSSRSRPPRASSACRPPTRR